MQMCQLYILLLSYTRLDETQICEYNTEICSMELKGKVQVVRVQVEYNNINENFLGVREAYDFELVLFHCKLNNKKKRSLN